MVKVKRNGGAKPKAEGDAWRPVGVSVGERLRTCVLKREESGNYF